MISLNLHHHLHFSFLRALRRIVAFVRRIWFGCLSEGAFPSASVHTAAWWKYWTSPSQSPYLRMALYFQWIKLPEICHRNIPCKNVWSCVKCDLNDNGTNYPFKRNKSLAILSWHRYSGWNMSLYDDEHWHSSLFWCSPAAVTLNVEESENFSHLNGSMDLRCLKNS